MCAAAVAAAWAAKFAAACTACGLFDGNKDGEDEDINLNGEAGVVVGARETGSRAAALSSATVSRASPGAVESVPSANAPS